MMIIFELDRRFAIDLVVTELNQKPGDVIPIRRKAQGEKRITPASGLKRRV
jgi:DNA-directed RNA polymerase subunit H (RpoH/RPB5)